MLAQAASHSRPAAATGTIPTTWARLHCVAFWVWLALWRGWDALAFCAASCAGATPSPAAARATHARGSAPPVPAGGSGSGSACARGEPAPSAAPSAPAAGAVATPAPAAAPPPAGGGNATPATGGGDGGSGSGSGGGGGGRPDGLARYRSVLAAHTAGIHFVTKFHNLHLSHHPHLSSAQGVAALRARLEHRASEVVSRMRGTPVAVCLVQLDIAAGCIVVNGRWELQGAEGMSEQDMRALVEDVMMEEMWQEVDPVPEGMHTPASVLDTGVLDSTSTLWQLGPDSDDGDDVTQPPPQPVTTVETGRPAAGAEAARPPQPPVPPATAGVPLLAVTTPLLALPRDSSARVHLQFATPLLAAALGVDPELVVSFAPAGGAGVGAPAPHASLLRARVCDLQAAARAHGNPPGLMDVLVDMGVGDGEGVDGGAAARAARAHGGVLIAHLVVGPVLLATAPVPLLPSAARPAACELSRLRLDARVALHVAFDLSLLVLAPRAGEAPHHERRALMRSAAAHLAQWARQAGHLPATLALLDDVAAQLDAADASDAAQQLRDSAVVSVGAAGAPFSGADAGAPSPAAAGAVGTDDGGGGSVSMADASPTGRPRHSLPCCPVGLSTLWCRCNVCVCLLLGLHTALASGRLPYDACMVAQFGSYVGLLGMFRTWVEEPVDGACVWWCLRAALALALEAPVQLSVLSACTAGEGCGDARWGPGAWGAFLASGPDFAAYVALRTVALLAFDAAL
ncbi:hypothetical protein FOA52_007571 [Chlamydomonas sp. UWO 241]|nr:hypothetical protein FOA52_007571 [Chlamydomonas sp. UWO 241]